MLCFISPAQVIRAVAEALIRRLGEATQLATIQNLRERLGRLGLRMMKPDLVILDEFQRFFEILEPFRGASDAESNAAATEVDGECGFRLKPATVPI